MPEEPTYSISELGWARDDSTSNPLLWARTFWSGAHHLKFLLATVALATVVTVNLVRLAASDYDKDYYFDEMWRVDLVRTPHLVEQYFANNAPAPPGWFLALRLIGTVVPNGLPRSLRLQNIVLDALMFLLLALLIDRMLTRQGPPPVTRLVAPVTAALVTLFPAYANLAHYLNDYMFQAACTIAVIVLWRVHDQRPFGRMALFAAIVLLPIATLSGLLVLPVMAVDVLRGDLGSAREGRGWQSLAGTAGAFLCSAAVAVGLYLCLYRPVVDHGIRSYWADATLSQSPPASVLQASWTRLLNMSISDAVSVFPHGYGGPAAAAALVGLAVAGFFLLGRLWVWFPVAFVSAWLLLAVASLAGWPMTPERMNLPILWMFHTAVAFTVVYGAARLIRHPALVVSVGTVLFWAFWPTPGPAAGEPFARGLTSDLEVVAASTESRNIVVSYHPMSHWYADDRLVTGNAGPDTFEIVREPWYGAEPLYDNPDEAVRAAGWRPGTAVWCVVPFEVGPQYASRACRIGLPGLTKQVQIRGERANIIGWLPDRG